jgi:hypothetical protein
MTFTDAAAEVLRLLGRPLHYKEITDYAIEKNLLSHVGKSPEVTMGARLAALMKKDGPDNPLVRVKPGVFALREWDEKTIREGLSGKKKRGKPGVAEDAIAALPEEEAEESEPEPEEEVEAVGETDDELLVVPEAPAQAPRGRSPGPAPRATSPVFAEDEEPPADEPEDRMRAELVAGAAEMFDDEEDDDQPILGADEPRSDTSEGRRRRRRRRRGRGGAEGPLPTYTATPIDGGRRDEGGRREDGRREEGRREERPAVDYLGEDRGPVDDLGGRDFADAVHQLLGTFDRSLGPVSLRQIAEAAQRRGKIAGDVQLVQSMVAAAVRADNLRRSASGQRPRFRFAGGRVALTDWVLGGDLASLEHDALVAVERYREASRRALLKKLSELPGHAFVELALLALERAGVSQIRQVRRAGQPGGEAHFSAVMKAPPDGAGSVRVAVLVRRDGREVGRERVTELRGSLHHYAMATMGWILTSGQVLSGAREEAGAEGVAPITLTDGHGFARLCEDNDVAVVRTRIQLAIPDVDLLEALRAS